MSHPVRLPGTDVPLTTLVDLCRARATAEPDRPAFRHHPEGTTLTLGEFDARARALAVRLAATTPPGSRALLAFAPGVHFAVALAGCFYAGVIAVPVPSLAGPGARAESVVGNARPTVVLSTAGELAELAEAALGDLVPIGVDEVDPRTADRWRRPPIGPESVAYLQYSSGSTGVPKGVTLTHANVLHNLALIHQATSRPSDGEGVPRPTSLLWLPQHYNMGLIGSVLEPLFSGHDVVTMAASRFVRSPYSWLRALSDIGRVDTAAPNFALELAARRVTDAQRATLDLSGVEMLLIGGEPVRASTLDRFHDTFAGTGLRRDALVPGYGLAESTVLVTAAQLGDGPVVLRVDRDALAAGLARPVPPGTNGRRLVSSGPVPPSVAVVTVDPATGQPCADGRIGEIHVSGPSVGAGYWNAEPDLSDVFHTVLPDHPGRRFLRTGDLGFRYDGELFVTGRAKEVIIIAGTNHYPHDIETTVEGAHPAVREGGVCALGVDDGSREQLVVLAEVVPESTVDASRLAQTIRRAVHVEHGLQVHRVELLCPGSLPYTVNGKLRRADCLKAHLSGALPRWKP
ncbi:fatty acyl-AMP ligase [Saccharothrix variisporea]|uniref:Acyl-CoA synthetase (AMP-forming)/AMP-acid ligase II n=1 Tax=Saccharothrix variisporea TaxID=543527 RepID=A0A495X549_9PSEU|nr:fatty acyl-AMP ligase [Saccharothrix variisporea]RKT67743.1 acyl-CoA synthetase (AMP-forming)/AMP-acid ligase II [Saccharothrix variisporea]